MSLAKSKKKKKAAKEDDKLDNMLALKLKTTFGVYRSVRQLLYTSVILTQ